ncbi:MAG: mono/diheme cytochrome c family protein [Myxococcota bacterium]|jgi:mono/diheme cytochrome c family protein
MRILLWLMAACAKTDHIERLPDAPVPVPTLTADVDPVMSRGAQLYRTASCVGCHSPPFSDGTHLGGGRDLPTMFGVFYAPNISPDPVEGIGGWSEADFVTAMRQGRAPDGSRYWPTFPYMTYTGMSDDDLHALWVYLTAQPPVDTTSRTHSINAPYRYPGMLGMWRLMAFRDGPLEDDTRQSDQWNRGRYLVKAVSYCDQCHTPRGPLGLVKKRHDMAGGANPGKADIHPNLTPDPVVGLGEWSEADIAAYLSTAVKPDGTQTEDKDIMAEKIHDSFSHYSDEDRAAIAAYLAALPADDFDPAQWRVVRRAQRKLASEGAQ